MLTKSRLVVMDTRLKVLILDNFEIFKSVRFGMEYYHVEQIYKNPKKFLLWCSGADFSYGPFTKDVRLTPGEGCVESGRSIVIRV